jgi:capsular exopolysaccharide synthesis family protein
MNSLLDSRRPEAAASVLVISSPNMRDGKTTLTCNLGIAFAETGRKVLLVDCDLRRPRLQRVFDRQSEFGLNDLLEGEMSLRNCPVSSLAGATGVPGVFVLTAKIPNRSISTLLHSKRMAELLDRLRLEFDTILIDTPPMLHLADARVIARIADGVVLVLQAGVDADEAEYCSRVLSEVGTPVLGVVLNNFNPARESRFRYYRSYHEEREPSVGRRP